MSIATLRAELDRRPDTAVYLLRIAGIPRTFASADITLSGETVRPELVDYTEIDAQVDPMTNRVTSGRITCRLEVDPKNDTHDYLSRRTRKGSNYVARLASTIEQDEDAPTVTSVVDISDWPATGTLFVGTEAMRYTARTTVAPFEFTVAERGYLDTERQRHVADASRSSYPRIYDRCVTWNWRPVTLSMTRRRLDGSVAPDEVELAAGWLAGPPDRDARGRIVVTLVPLPVAVEQEIGGEKAKTYPARGVIPIAGDDEIRSVLLRLRWRAGQAFRERAAGVTADNRINDVRHQGHGDVFDSSQSGARNGPLVINGLSNTEVSGYNGDAVDGTGDIDIVANINEGANSVVQNAEVFVDLQADVATAGVDTLVEWPSAVISASATNWNPGTTQGADGQWADLRIEPRLPGIGGRPGLTARLNSDHHAGPLELIVPNGRTPDLPLPYRETLWYLADFTDPEVDGIGPQPQPLDGASPLDHNWLPERVVELSVGKSDTSTPRQAVPIRALASGGWQTGMRWIYVRDDVFGATPFYIKVTFEGIDGSELQTTPRIVDRVPASDWVPGAVGYLLQVDDDDRWRRHSFGIFDGRKVPEISQLVRWQFTTPGEALLQLLTSTVGRGYNGAYDVLPSGGNVPIARVDVSSFTDFPTPGGVIDLVDDLDISQPFKLESAIDGLLELMQAQLTTALDESTGKQVLRLQSVGVPSAGDARHTFGANDLFIGPAAHSKADARVVTTQVFEANVGEDDKPRLIVSITDDEALNDNGGRRSTRTIRLTGVRLADNAALADAQLRPLAEQRFPLIGASRHHLVATCKMTDAVFLNPGSVVIISAPTAVDAQGKSGTIVDVPARILVLRRSLKKMQAKMILLYMDTTVAGIAPALRADGSPSADSLTVMANRYSLPNHPVTGEAQTDLSFFQVGDRARVVPRGRYEDSLGELYVSQIDHTAKRIWFEELVGGDIDNRVPANLPAIARAEPFCTVRFERCSLPNGVDADGNARTWGETLESQGRNYAFFGPRTNGSNNQYG